MSLHRFAFACLIGCAVPLTATAESSEFATPSGAMSEKVLGEADADITIIEYASLTCPHCAQFHEEILPMIKAAYIDTGKAKLVFRDFPLDEAALKASLLARCAPEDQFFTFLEVLFSQQDSWARSEDPVQALATLGTLGGVSEQRFAACLANESLNNYVLQTRLDGQKEYSVESTPTVIINGTKLAHVSSFDEIKETVDALLQ